MTKLLSLFLLIGCFSIYHLRADFELGKYILEINGYCGAVKNFKLFYCIHMVVL